jgi:hypothetical protein
VKSPAKLLGLFALWLVPLVANSAVRYEFSGFNSGDFGGPSDNPISFVFESDGFVTTTSTPIPASMFASCSAGSGECVEIQFFIDTVTTVRFSAGSEAKKRVLMRVLGQFGLVPI